MTRDKGLEALINDELDSTVAELMSIIDSARCR